MAYSNVGEPAEGGFKSGAKNPFDSSSSEEEEIHASQMKKTSIFPVTQNSNPFDDAEEEEILQPRGVQNPNPNSYSNPFDDLEEDDYVNHAVQDLENHALDKSRETTSAIVNLVKVAEDTRGVAGSTLETLHDQGTQIQHTHEKAVHLDQHLERGEKLLNSLGGIFSKSWKPKKTRKITGPMISRGESFKRRGTPADRAALGLTEGQRYGEEKRYSGGSSLMRESTDFQSQVVTERKIQDDALSDLSNVIGQLKEMSVDMHTEIARQNDGLEHLTDDANELHSRIQQSNMRARRVLRR
ncbi:unnamed protein product [Sphagnum tenellum]